MYSGTEMPCLIEDCDFTATSLLLMRRHRVHVHDLRQLRRCDVHSREASHESKSLLALCTGERLCRAEEAASLTFALVNALAARDEAQRLLNKTQEQARNAPIMRNVDGDARRAELALRRELVCDEWDAVARRPANDRGKPWKTSRELFTRRTVDQIVRIGARGRGVSCSAPRTLQKHSTRDQSRTAAQSAAFVCSKRRQNGFSVQTARVPPNAFYNTRIQRTTQHNTSTNEHD